jgi:hypothetical protein
MITKKSTTVSSKTIRKFSDLTFDHLTTRLLDEREGKETGVEGSF